MLILRCNYTTSLISRSDSESNFKIYSEIFYIFNRLKDTLSITPRNYQPYGLFQLLEKFKTLNNGVGARLKCKSYENGNLRGLQTSEEEQKLGTSLRKAILSNLSQF